MSTRDSAARFGGERTRGVVRLLTAIQDWRLLPGSWEETGRQLAELEKAVADGDTDTVDRVTADLENGSPRVVRIGAGGEPAGPDDRKVPPSPQLRERLLTLVHVLDPAAPGPVPQGGPGRGPGLEPGRGPGHR